ncbi:hypothetical protein Cflav_PD5367 [Pedosphaera parvula Ellin514]|uniref:Uncharacterized protein n=1 Tax=Pedosphaera parvula (strain Ellin514) TaxID=320771 RepID=B9XB47_PEDPL|nr:hypothetical protein Cflav_PD5367 [Pedosphaera parvula Ellin514]
MRGHIYRMPKEISEWQEGFWFKSLILKLGRVLFSRKRPDGKARRRRISLVDLRLRSNAARRPLARKPSGRRCFWPQPALARPSRWRGCSGLADLAAAKIPNRSTLPNFKSGSKARPTTPPQIKSTLYPMTNEVPRPQGHGFFSLHFHPAY